MRGIYRQVLPQVQEFGLAFDMACAKRISLLLGLCVAVCCLRQGRGDELKKPPPEAGELPPEGWWVPATLKLPKAADGRIAWRFTLREVITITSDNKLERRAADLKLVKPHTFSTETPVPMLIELDEKQRSLTVTILKPKAAFFTLNPAGDADIRRFDNLVINVHADSAEVTAVCDKATRCIRLLSRDDLASQIGPSGERTLTSCREVLSTVRQDLAAEHHAIPTICR
jgi:hypothetical protein